MKTKTVIETRIARLRSAIMRAPEGSQEERQLSAELSAALSELKLLPDDSPRGQFSGLTRAELARTRTCETDWI